MDFEIDGEKDSQMSGLKMAKFAMLSYTGTKQLVLVRKNIKSNDI